MLKIVTLMCALAGLLAALVLISWIRNRAGMYEQHARIFAVSSLRSSVFRKYQGGGIAVLAVVMAASIGIGIGWKNAAVYIIGTVCCFGAVAASSASFPYGLSASAGALGRRDTGESFRISYRAGGASSLIASSIGLMILGLLYIIFEIEDVMGTIAGLALAASTVSVFFNSGGNIYSNAYRLSRRNDDFTDISGTWYGGTAEIIESMAVSATAVAFLAEVGVNTSGVSSTFTAAMAAKFPLLVFAGGIASGIISMAISRTGSRGRDYSSPAGSLFISGIITMLLSLYFSLHMLQSLVYSWCILSGIIAASVSAALSVYLAYDSKLFKGIYGFERNTNANTRFVYGHYRGMSMLFINIILILAAVVISFEFAGLYGAALASAGVCSVNAVYGAIGAMGAMTSCAADIASAEASADDASGKGFDPEKVYSGAERAGVFTNSYNAASSFFTSFALLIAVIYSSGKESLNLLNTHVMTGFIGGVGAAFVLTGLTVNALRVTSDVLSSNAGKDEDRSNAGSIRGASAPLILMIIISAAAGILFGIDSLTGFLLGMVLTMYCVTETSVMSGSIFCSESVKASASVVRFAILLTAVFVKIFINNGGLLF